MPQGCNSLRRRGHSGLCRGIFVTGNIARGAHVVVGTSGLTDADFNEIDVAARKHQRGVLACGNFALTVVLMQKFAEASASALAKSSSMPIV